MNKSYLKIFILGLFTIYIVGTSLHVCNADDLSTKQQDFYTSNDYALLINNQKISFKNWQLELRKLGINATHWFSPDAAIYRISSIDEFSKINNIPAKIYTTIREEEIASISSLSDEIRIAVYSFLKLKSISSSDEDYPLMAPADIAKSDALIAPIQAEIQLATCNATGLKRSGSEYMLRNILVNVILMESNGAIDPSTENWSAARENTVTSEITAAMNFLATSYNLNANLTPSFTYHYYLGRINSVAQTSYEPINRVADPMNEPGTSEGL